MQILIIEDEPRAARQLQTLLQACNFEHQLLEVIDSIEQAVDWFENKQSPDLVFMDIQLADGLSFEIFQKTEVFVPIIFTTAFDQYAIEAFKVNSIDYLLKPIQQEDLGRALAKFTKNAKPNLVEPTILKQLLGTIQQSNKRKGLLVKEGNGFVQLKVDEVLYFYSEDSITFGVTSSKRYVIDETLDQLFDSLNNESFFKINRGQVIAKHAIQKIDPYFNHRVKLVVENTMKQEFIVSRQRTNDFKVWMNW